MAGVSEKHMVQAEKVLDLILCPCAPGEDPREASIYVISHALANAERESMKRAAEIAREYGDFEPDCPHGEGFWRACDNLAAAILSEAGEA